MCFENKPWELPPAHELGMAACKWLFCGLELASFPVGMLGVLGRAGPWESPHRPRL